MPCSGMGRVTRCVLAGTVRFLLVATAVAGWLLLAMSAPRAARVDVVGHRGTAYRPENTKPALSNAAAKGVSWVEIDIRCSADGVLFAVHDKTLDRTTTGSGRVDRRTARYIRSLRALERWPAYRRRSASYDGRFKIPTLAGIINRARDEGVGLWVDSKTRDCERKMLNRLQAAADTGLSVRFAAVDDAQRRFANNNYDLELGGGHFRPDDVDSAGKIKAAVTQPAKVTFISVRWDAVSTELVDAAHEQGLQVWVWTFRAQNRWLPYAYRSYHADTLDCRRRRGRMDDWLRDVFVPMGIDGVMVDEPNHTGLLS